MTVPRDTPEQQAARRAELARNWLPPRLRETRVKNREIAPCQVCGREMRLVKGVVATHKRRLRRCSGSQQPSSGPFQSNRGVT